MQQNTFNRAKTLVDRMNLGASCSDYIIEWRNLGEDCLGSYTPATGKIALDPKLFQQGTKQIVSTLFEEMLHATTGLQDCTYPMQTHLFNLIVSLHEEHIFGEAC